MFAADQDTLRLNDDGAAAIPLDIPGGAGYQLRARAYWDGDRANPGDTSPWALFSLV